MALEGIPIELQQITLQGKILADHLQLKQQVNDVCWSPKTSSVFASVANDGRIEVWDLKRDNL